MKRLWDNVLKNLLLLYCSIYTVVTIWNSVEYLAYGIYEDPSGNWHEIDRAIVVLIGVIAYAICRYVKLKNVALRLAAAYVPTMLTVFAYVWFSGLREPLAADAYQGIFFLFSGMFVIIAAAVLIMEAVRKKRAK